MNKKLHSIIKMSYDKYGANHPLSIKIAQTLNRFLENDAGSPELDMILEQSLDVNIDELESLINPDKFEFEEQDLGDIGVEK